MQIQGVLNGYYKLRYNIFSWRYNANIIYKVLMVIVMACITGISAQIKFYLPWTPVPVTGQTFVVLMSGILLGANWGGLSQLVYVLIGIAGIPWFSTGKAGLSTLLGPTGGYLIGFILASLFLGYFVDKYVRSRKFLPMLALMLVANFIFIYGFGIIQLGIWANFINNKEVGFMALLNMGVIPFIAGDIVKILIASGVTKVITPKKDYK